MAHLSFMIGAIRNAGRVCDHYRAADLFQGNCDAPPTSSRREPIERTRPLLDFPRMEGRLLEACMAMLSREIASGLQVIDVGVQTRERIDLLIVRGDGARRRVVVDLAPERATIYLAAAAHAPVDGGDAFRRILSGQWIVGADQPVPRSLMRLLLRRPDENGSGTWLVFEWLGARPDALIVDGGTREVLARAGADTAAHADRRTIGCAYAWPPPPRRPFYGDLSEDQVHSILRGVEAHADRARALSRGCSELPNYLAFEAIQRSISSDPAASDGNIARILHEIAEVPFAPALYLIGDDGPPGVPAAFVSPIPLESLEAHREAIGETDMNRMLARAHEAVLRSERENRVRDGYRRLIAAEERRILKLRGRLKAEESEAARAPTLRRSAEALLIHLAEIPRGARRFRCPDPNDPTATLEVDLDPRYSVPANADILFRRARRLERGELLRARRLAAIDAAVTRLSMLGKQVETDVKSVARGGGAPFRDALGPFSREGSIDQWKGIGDPVSVPGRRTAAPSRPRASATPGRPADERFHPRTYRTREGWTVLVGRSNEENDYVTHRLARPEDYWFHAHGCPGSHVVLRREGRKDNPSARTIEEAASIAAWFSKSRTSKRAPISYTLKKYVRKARKGPPGLAIITREKTILVEPKAPVATEPGGWGDEEI